MPDYKFKSIYDITIDFLSKHAIKALILDIDNTLASYSEINPSKKTIDYINHLKENSILLAIASNTGGKRGKNFSDELGVPFYAPALKPLTFKLRRLCKDFNLHPSQIAMIGDQLFTDILGGNLAKMMTILVEPFDLNEGFFIYMKRKIENIILSREDER